MGHAGNMALTLTNPVDGDDVDTLVGTLEPEFEAIVRELVQSILWRDHRIELFREWAKKELEEEAFQKREAEREEMYRRNKVSGLFF